MQHGGAQPEPAGALDSGMKKLQGRLGIRNRCVSQVRPDSHNPHSAGLFKFPGSLTQRWPEFGQSAVAVEPCINFEMYGSCGAGYFAFKLL
jgi:hypothetical protein